MPKTITLKLTEDEAEIIADALDSDLEGYVESAKDARANRDKSAVEMFAEAAERITAVRDRVRAMLGDE